jgi:hypothetical protein
MEDRKSRCGEFGQEDTIGGWPELSAKKPGRLLKGFGLSVCRLTNLSMA